MKINNLLRIDTHKKILEDEFYVDIITNENFNPGVVALICERLKNRKISNVKEYILKAVGGKLKIWDYLYDVYLQCVNAINILQEDKNANVFNIGKKYIEDKYFK